MRIFTVALTIMMSSCIKVYFPGPPNPDPPGEGCSEACLHLRALGCPEGHPLENGVTCERFCEDTETQGHSLNTECIISAPSCEDVRVKCNR